MNQTFNHDTNIPIYDMKEIPGKSRYLNISQMLFDKDMLNYMKGNESGGRKNINKKIQQCSPTPKVKSSTPNMFAL